MVKIVLPNGLVAFKNNYSSVYFIVKFLLFYFILDYFTLFYIGITAPGNLYFPWLDQHLNYIRALRHLLLGTSAFLLQQMGYVTYTSDILLYVYGHGGVKLVYSCLGYGVMSFFAAFVLAWPKPIKSKALFLPVGLLLIQSLNIVRFILLSLHGNKQLENLKIDHHSLFNLILYLMVMGILYWWVNRRVVSDKL